MKHRPGALRRRGVQVGDLLPVEVDTARGEVLRDRVLTEPSTLPATRDLVLAGPGWLVPVARRADLTAASMAGLGLSDGYDGDADVEGGPGGVGGDGGQVEASGQGQAGSVAEGQAGAAGQGPQPGRCARVEGAEGFDL